MSPDALDPAHHSGQISYPGVCLEEVASGVRAITAVATSITAFVGRAGRGTTERPVVVMSFGDFERVFGGLWNGSRLGFAVRDFFLNGGSTAVIVRLYRPDSGAGAKLAKAKLNVDTLQLEAAEEGQWGNSLRARVDFATRPFDPSLGETSTSLFNLFVRDGTTGVVEEHRNVVVAPASHPRLATNVLMNESKLVRVLATGANRPTASDDPPDPTKDVWSDDTPATNAKVATEGESSDGQPLTSSEFDGTGVAGKSGLYRLELTDLFNLVVIPPYKSDDTVDTSVVTSAAAYCEQRRAMLLVDPPSAWSETSDITSVFSSPGLAAALGTDSKNAALFFPRLQEANPLNDNQVEAFAPSGAIAGVMARTDARRGVWTAPAGLDATLTGVVDLTVPLNDGDIGQLNPLAVNCLRVMPAAGPVVWGARTMRGADLFASEWKYIPVRRTALFIEESLYRGTQWVVFEPNDEPLWAQIRLNVGTFMNSLFRQGAFQGSTPHEAYFVKCDKETTTQADIDVGIVNILVGFAPLEPAEFVVIRLQQMAGKTAL